MYFYHEGYHDTYYADACLEALTSPDRRGDYRTYEPIRTPAIVGWLTITSVALCVVIAVIHGLS